MIIIIRGARAELSTVCDRCKEDNNEYLMSLLAQVEMTISIMLMFI